MKFEPQADKSHKIFIITRKTIFAVTHDAKVKGKHRVENGRGEGEEILAKSNDGRQINSRS